ncbi:FkbM family methyltransferase [Kamptonema cortianum]|uniref:FkbM family methyltransferase n=1 Tax=Geitlerinema calcuttense NRMC-F 0142 TaxID=2922238 RepID=A0ABT7LY77_9CYAN|nr:FkbM family methyltransferase [Geitlerinema calcuttense]MDK3157471.1 FkbM family methyltransferase [Kamptonema cortianum]MDL5056964.1 FkbM family methyltransferase [Geitlerinema calcuttense NRMC-F 0142]
MSSTLKKINLGFGRLNKAIKVTFFPKNIYTYNRPAHDYHNLSYSQEGEDRILSRIFEGQNQGFYVDVGAHHPQRFSNTYLFYLLGWRGMNIDAKPGSMSLFQKIRPNDINLELPISDSYQVLTYYEFNEPALNGFCPEISQERDGLHHYRIIKTHQLQTYTLSEVLDQYLPKEQQIDFLNVDVEGLDYQVLKSNNWSKYKPKVILAEDLNFSFLDNPPKSKVASLLFDQGYEIYAKSGFTLVFKLRA